MTEEEKRGFAIEVVEGLAHIAKQYRCETRSEVPMSVHFIRFPEQSDLRPEVIPVDPTRLGDDKETMALSIRLMVQMLGARYVIMVNEAWASYQDSTDELEALETWTAAGKSLEHFPGRKEVLMVSLDGPDVSLMFSGIIQEDGSASTLERMEGLETHGRLANLSYPQATKGSEVWN